MKRFDGAGIGILVNANAKRGGRRVAAQLARALPRASVKLTRSIDEVDDWVASMRGARCLLSAGGDGSAIVLLNALERVMPHEPWPVVGPLPLGTGNAWARALGSRKLGEDVRALQRHDGPLPTRRYGLLDCEGTLTFFAGSGWDAQVLDEYRLQVERSPSSRLAKTVWGYLAAVFFKTAPKTMIHGRPRVLVESLADEVYTVDAQGRLLRDPRLGRGSVLYDGLASVAGAATCPEFGYGFRAYPFAERLLGAMSVRVYDETALQALAAIPKLWRGAHPLAGMHDWITTHVRMTFSRPVALQIAGEAVGPRRTVEYRALDREVRALEWRRVG